MGGIPSPYNAKFNPTFSDLEPLSKLKINPLNMINHRNIEEIILTARGSINNEGKMPSSQTVNQSNISNANHGNDSA